MAAPRVEILPALTDRLRADVTAVIAAAREADGVSPLSEHGVLSLRGGDAIRHAVARGTDRELVGYGQLDRSGATATAELVVAPDARRRGHGGALLRALHTLAGAQMHVWAHGHTPGAQALARAEGMEPSRELWQMRRPLDASLPEVEPVEGVVLRTFRPGEDDDAWLALNAEAFAEHPEQGSWTREDLQARLAEPWFDAGGFFLAEREGRLVGFHWTKVHADERLGEVYVLAVAAEARGTGLAPALALTGLHHLRERGLPEAMLYVEADNEPAVRTYRRLGFTTHTADVLYRLTPA